MLFQYIKYFAPQKHPTRRTTSRFEKPYAVYF